MGLKIDRRAQRITKIIGLVVLVAVIFCMLKIFIWEQNYYRNKSAEERNPEQSVITELEDADNPSEEKPSKEDVNNYQVQRETPRYLIIKRLSVKARVQESNVNEHILPVPENIYDVSWYSGSGRPGEGTNILISGISEGATKAGAFSNLDSIEKNDIITLENGGGDKFEYVVREIAIIDKDEAKNRLPIAQKRIDDKETLSLITARRANESNDKFNSIIMLRATRK